MPAVPVQLPAAVLRVPAQTGMQAQAGAVQTLPVAVCLPAALLPLPAAARPQTGSQARAQAGAVQGRLTVPLPVPVPAAGVGMRLPPTVLSVPEEAKTTIPTTARASTTGTPVPLPDVAIVLPLLGIPAAHAVPADGRLRRQPALRCLRHHVIVSRTAAASCVHAANKRPLEFSPLLPFARAAVSWRH
jgi:hypothetical protein